MGKRVENKQKKFGRRQKWAKTIFTFHSTTIYTTETKVCVCVGVCTMCVSTCVCVGVCVGVTKRAECGVSVNSYVRYM